MTVEETAVAYGSAVGVSCTIALGMSRFVQSLRNPSARRVLGLLVPFVAVASAGALNVFLMRRKELTYVRTIYPYCIH